MSDDEFTPETVPMGDNISDEMAEPEYPGFVPETDFQREVLSHLDFLHHRIEFAVLQQSYIRDDINALKNGVNTIGAMMNSVSDAFGQISSQIQQGGIGSLLGMIGAKKDG